jgi:uncharacterized protein with von Willebrand factor type A (vWA) domain
MPGILAGIRYDDPLVRYRGDKLVELVKRLSKSKRADMINTDFGVDVFYLFYLPFPILTPPRSEKDPWTQLRYMIAREILATEEARKIRYYTIAHSGRSIIVGASFLEHLLNELSSQQGGEGSEGGREGESSDQGEGGDESDRDRGSSLRDAIRNALRKIGNELDNISKLEHLSMGTQAGTGSVLEMLESSGDILRLARNTDVQKLLDSLSFIEDMTLRFRKKTIKSPKGEVIGYTRGSHIQRASRSELALFESEDASWVLLYKWATGKMILYEKVVRQDYGPLYVLLDKSGSMDGEKIRWAKATAIALFMRARKEGRPFLIRFFDSAPYSLIKVSRSSKPSETLRLMDYLARIKSGGGTDITRSIIAACQDISELKMKGLGELILITDGEDRIAENMVRRHLKENNLKLITVMVMGENPDLRRISAKYFKVAKLSNKEMLEVLEL